MIDRICEVCAEKFRTHACYVARGAGKYCSRRCYHVEVGNRQRLQGRGHNYKSGSLRHKGYVLGWAPKHPNNVKGYVPMHRLVMELYLGRYLNATEVVHHKNGIKDDNRFDNLEVVSPKAHMRTHRAIWIKIRGRKYTFVEACARIGRAPVSVRGVCRRRGLTHQEAIDDYLSGKVVPRWPK